MEASILLQIIKDDIKILNNLALDLNKDADLSSDEVEIVLARARNVVKELELLETKVSEAGLSTLKVISQEKPETLEKPIKEKEDSQKEIPVAKDEEQQKVQEATKMKSDEQTSLENGEISDDSDIELLDDKQIEKGKTLGESVAAQRSLNDLIGSDKPDDVFMHRPLKSIREGIGLNDRYLFVRELFGNNNEKFNETIDSLDHAKNIQEAVHFLKSHFKWSKSDTSQKFLILVKRRFLN